MNTTASIKYDLSSITAPVEADLAQLDQLIIHSLTSSIPLIQEIVKHILAGKGKRLRPLLVILCAKACGHKDDNDHLRLAAIIEFVHTATLLHDDVVDNSELRRGKQTANTLWGNQASVLVGDFLYSRAFQMLTHLNQPTIMQILSSTTNTIAEGEVMQLMNTQNADLSEQDYFDVIYQKTAKLFESSAEIGAALTHSPYQTQLATFGKHIGLCFQIVDDLLDYTASSEQMGKNVGDDLSDGKMTLPLIYTLKQISADKQTIIKEAIESRSANSLPAIISLIHTTSAIEQCEKIAHHQATLARQAISPLPTSVHKTALLALVDFALQRNY